MGGERERVEKEPEGCQGGTACGSGLRLRTVCTSMSVFTQPGLHYLRSNGIRASHSIFWESLEKRPLIKLHFLEPVTTV